MKNRGVLIGNGGDFLFYYRVGIANPDQRIANPDQRNFFIVLSGRDYKSRPAHNVDLRKVAAID
jgi:hypothetical protein